MRPMTIVGALLALLVALVTGVGTASSASAATTAPTRYSTTTNDGTGNVSVTFTVPTGGAYVAGEVSADTQLANALSDTVKEGTTTVPLLVARSLSGTFPAPGLAGVSGKFLSAGSHTWTATLSGTGASTADIWMAVAVYTGASGFSGTAANSDQYDCAYVTLTTGNVNSLVGAVGHDWDYGTTVVAGGFGFTAQTLAAQYNNPTIGDDGYSLVTTNGTTFGQTVKLGVSSPCGGNQHSSLDRWNIVAYEVLGV
jgi:hypothetical protein